MKTKLCTFYIVRHGETEWNVQRRLQGHGNSALTKNGKQQIKALRTSLRDTTFDAIYSSDLARTQQTADILNIERRLAINTTELIRERSFGTHEGKLVEEYQREIRHLLDEYESLSEEQKFSFKYPGVESDEEVISRFIRFLRETAVAYPGKKILVVSHGGAMRALLVHLGFSTYTEDLYVNNAAYAVIESDGTDFFIKKTEGIHTIPA